MGAQRPGDGGDGGQLVGRERMRCPVVSLSASSTLVVTLRTTRKLQSPKTEPEKELPPTLSTPPTPTGSGTTPNPRYETDTDE